MLRKILEKIRAARQIKYLKRKGCFGCAYCLWFYGGWYCARPDKDWLTKELYREGCFGGKKNVRAT